MNDMPPFGLQPDEHRRPQQPPTFQRTANIVSIVSGVATIIALAIAARRGAQWWLIWLLGVIAGLLLLSVAYRPVAAFARMLMAHRTDNLVAREYWPRFQALVHQFGQFVNPSTNDTLHAIITSDVPDPLRSEMYSLIVNISVFSGFWYFFRMRIDNHLPRLDELAAAVQEFHHLVGQYDNFCALTIFDRLPEEMRKKIPERSKNKLNTFHLRFHQFLTAFVQFCHEFSRARPQLAALPKFLPFPTQL
jgi:hypothetical protein